MAVMRVSPTRMELSKLKKRLVVAVRGHKLLKDKRDEMMRQFVLLIKENKRLRVDAEDRLSAALKNFLMARATMGSEALEEAILWPVRDFSLEVAKKNIMSVNVPVFTVETLGESGSNYPYGFLSTSAELDQAIAALNAAVMELIRLAEIEKTCNILADEIEKTRRRVNALEYVMIPELEETIRDITMKLDENERSNVVRLMKIKDILAKRNVQA